MNNLKINKGKVVEKLWGHELHIHNSPSYCGKLLVFNKGSNSSMHYHILKEETWYVSKGEFNYTWIDTTNAERHTEVIKEGDVIHIIQGQPHQLQALTEGATVFEVSTQYFEEDSYRIGPSNIQL